MKFKAAVIAIKFILKLLPINLNNYLFYIINQKMMNMIIMIRQEKGYSVTNLDDSIIQVIKNK